MFKNWVNGVKNKKRTTNILLLTLITALILPLPTNQQSFSGFHGMSLKTKGEIVD
jgi:hypothetical protein